MASPDVSVRNRLAAEPLITGLVLKTTSVCNLDCTYCYVYHAKDQSFAERPTLLTEDLAVLVARRVKAYCEARPGHRITICLHGGEPLLLGKQRFRTLAEQLKRDLGPHLHALTVQTNGVLLDPAWIALFAELDVSVSVSLDGSPTDHDRHRVDHSGRGSHSRVARGLRYLANAQHPATVLCVVRPGGDGKAAYQQFRALGVRHIDFLLPDHSRDDVRPDAQAGGPTPVADYLIGALHAWLEEDDPSVEIRLFTDAFRLIMGEMGQTDAFGGCLPSTYVIVETDGSIQANDVLRVCESDMAETGLNIESHGLDDLSKASGMASDILNGRIALPDDCIGCREQTTCAGGYLPHRYSRERGFNNPSVWCRDIQALFGEARRLLDRSASPAAA